MTEDRHKSRAPHIAILKVLACCIALLGLIVCNALGAGTLKRVTVPIGGPVVVLESALVSGDRDTYVRAAKAGASEGDDVKEWSGRLVETGEYVTIVG